MSRVDVIWTGIYEDPVDRWHADIYRDTFGNVLSLTEDFICLICPEGFEDTDKVVSKIDPDNGEKRRNLVHVVSDENGVHIEPYWATPYSRNLPEGYRWASSGSLVKVGFRKACDGTNPWYKSEVIFLPLYDLIKSMDSGLVVSPDDLGLDRIWEEYVPDLWEELADLDPEERMLEY